MSKFLQMKTTTAVHPPALLQSEREPRSLKPSSLKENNLEHGENLNRVLSKDYKASANFFKSDKIFCNYLKNELSPGGNDYMQDKLERQGKEAATRMDALSL